MMTHAMVLTAVNEKQVSPTTHTHMCIVYSSQILHFTIQILFSFQSISGIAKCEPNTAQILPNVCCALHISIPVLQ